MRAWRGVIVAKTSRSVASLPILLLLGRMHLPRRETLDASWQTHAPMLNRTGLHVREILPKTWALLIPISFSHI